MPTNWRAKWTVFFLHFFVVFSSSCSQNITNSVPIIVKPKGFNRPLNKQFNTIKWWLLKHDIQCYLLFYTYDSGIRLWLWGTHTHRVMRVYLWIPCPYASWGIYTSMCIFYTTNTGLYARRVHFSFASLEYKYHCRARSPCGSNLLKVK